VRRPRVMFALTTLAYPAVLLLLCAGAGLLVDRLSGSWLPAVLLPAVGAAALIALSQLSTYASPLARATPYLMLAAATGGFAASRERLRAIWGRRRATARWLDWRLAAPLVVYALALAPVLLSGRATFSSYMALADSAVHMQGADYLLRHGQSYAHLDLRSSYGQFINAYYNSSYPSGSDTLFGASTVLLGLPLIWTFQPFDALMLALATGPLWVLARRAGLRGPWAALAAASAAVPALVYGYELLGSIKELTALCLLLALGALVTLHRSWLSGPARRALPFALASAGGISALGAGFGVWPLAAVLALALVFAGELRAGRVRVRGALGLVAFGAAVAFVAALPTWLDLSGSLRVAKNIASTGNPGNLHKPLRALQVFGVWLRGSYKQSPAGAALDATRVLIALAIAAGALGALSLLRRRQVALAAWLGLTLLVWVVVGASATTWADAKGEMLTSSALVLVCWAGVGALLASSRPLARAAGPLVALALAGGVLASDLAQYHSSNLAPTARYRELASVNDRFAGKGPALLIDFDEYALYQLRDLDVGGPDFAHPPLGLEALAGGYGQPIELDRADPRALAAYPLIITRRDPGQSPPPAAYRLAYEGSYYQVWRRQPAAASALSHRAASGSAAQQCAQIARLAQGTLARRTARASIVAALAPELVAVALSSARHPASWGHQRGGLVMSARGSLSAEFTLAHSGAWRLWLRGQLMPRIRLSVDGHRLGTVAGQLDGNSLVPDTIAAARAQLSAGRHRLVITRDGFSLAPGDGGSAVLDAIFLASQGLEARALRQAPAAAWQALCGPTYRWFELLSAA
jgi:hypothetical protein